MSLIAYPPVLNAQRIVPVHKAYVEAKRERIRSAKGIYTKEFIDQAREARTRADEAKELAEKQEARRQGMLTFRRQAMPDWARQIVEHICEKHGVCPSEMSSDNRKHRVVRARNEAIYLVKDRKPMLSSPQIGKWFGKDHTSILHSLASYSHATGAKSLVGYDIEGARERNRRKAHTNGRDALSRRNHGAIE
ncbi:hypothetical protein FJ973_29720 [Mesorhizobium sp. B2-1-3]|uniref:helix-turn-helix domain-containing protein n=1 Tax=Mesorhizobium sp. B2-1-3 TaxID=2589972 RepID=UPI00112B0DDB|nr:helix-turn-helix domain-containing protein [Mesorhizobium sp. B2-1-3]TPN03823.1 hypothetical protein FJ973_29720 [Mesorhizobium sp. B2-1-3]